MSAEDTQGVVPYILSSDADKHIEWMKNVLDGVEKFMFRSEDKEKVAHAVIAVNGGCVYITDLADKKAVKAVNDISIAVDNGAANEDGEQVANGDNQAGPRGFILQLDVEDPNVIWKKAMSSGCTVEMDLKVQYWGCMYGIFKDPFGFPWALAKTKEENRKRGVIPYLLTPEGECEKHIEWLKTAYGGEVKEKYCSDDGSKVLHCDVELNGYHVYLADQTEREESLNGKPHLFHCHLSVTDPKAMWETAMKNDAKTIVDMKVQFWGGLQGTLQDKFGFRWSLSPPSPATKSDSINSPGVVAYLLSPDCKQHIEFIKNVFDGKVKMLYHTDDQKKVMHCSMNVNGGELCLSDQLCTGENKEWPMQGEARGFMCHLDMSDPDATWKKAMENGATQVMELKKQFWGDYYGIFKDPLGYGWALRKEE